MKHLQFITHATDRYTDLDEVRMALQGGCRWIQLRMKGATDDEVLSVGKEAVRLCHHQHATLILDDRVALCPLIGADGVHLGRRDMPVAEARKILGPHAIIGATVNTVEDLCRAVDEGADYAGCGPFRFTTTKEHLAPLLGLDGYRHLVAARKKLSVRLPLIAIGGITRDDIPVILSTGVDGVAMSGCIVRAANPVEEMHKICKTINPTL